LSECADNSTEIVGTEPAATAVSRASLYFRGISIDYNELVDPSPEQSKLAD
jgi:hypothetical protein